MKKFVSLSLIGLMLVGVAMISTTDADARRIRPPFIHGHWIHPILPIWVGPRFVVVNTDYGYLDLDVHPEEAEVYINGEHIGICDSFDGFPQYLYLKKGKYTISFRLEGYLDFTREITVLPGRELEFNTRLKKAPPGSHRNSHDTYRDDHSHAHYSEMSESRNDHENSEQRPPSGNAAFLKFRIHPRNATVYLDGTFAGVAKELMEKGTFRLSPGEHLLEILMPGYDTASFKVIVRPGETEDIRVFLEKE